jgi:hypothetical protein
VEGITQFNKYLQMVRKDKRIHGNWFETKFREFLGCDQNGEPTETNNRKCIVVQRSVRADNDLISDEENDPEEEAYSQSNMQFNLSPHLNNRSAEKELGRTQSYDTEDVGSYTEDGNDSEEEQEVHCINLQNV